MEFRRRSGKGVKVLLYVCRWIEDDLSILSLTKLNVPDEVEVNDWLSGHD